jgi:hypothetical protein
MTARRDVVRDVLGPLDGDESLGAMTCAMRIRCPSASATRRGSCTSITTIGARSYGRWSDERVVDGPSRRRRRLGQGS